MTPVSGFESRFGRNMLPSGTTFEPRHLEALCEFLGAELIDGAHIQSLLKADSNIHVYIGYETQGRLHPGSLVGLGILRYLNQFQNVTTTIFLADLHTRLNMKTSDPSFSLAVDRLRTHFFPRPASFRIVQGTRDLHDLNYFFGFLQTHTNYTVARASRGARQNARSQILKVSDLLYACMQAYDLDALKIDLALGASDQRNKHMMHRDNPLARKAAYMHFPLITTAAGEKLSKSKGHGFEDLDLGSTGAKILEQLWGDLAALRSTLDTPT